MKWDEIAPSGRPHHFGTLEKNNWKNLLWKQKNSIQFFAIVNGLYYQHTTTTTKTKKKTINLFVLSQLFEWTKMKKKNLLCMCNERGQVYIWHNNYDKLFFWRFFFLISKINLIFVYYLLLCWNMKKKFKSNYRHIS